MNPRASPQGYDPTTLVLMDRNWRAFLFDTPNFWVVTTLTGLAVLVAAISYFYTQPVTASEIALIGISILISAVAAGAFYANFFFPRVMRRLIDHYQCVEVFTYIPKYSLSFTSRIKNPGVIWFECREESGQLPDCSFPAMTDLGRLVQPEARLLVTVNIERQTVYIYHPRHQFLIRDPDIAAKASMNCQSANLNMLVCAPFSPYQIKLPPAKADKAPEGM